MAHPIRSQAQAKKDFNDALQSLARTQSHWNVFEDFLDYALLMLRWQEVKEEDFNNVLKSYQQEQHKLFAQAFYAMADIADNDGKGFYDPFGDYFMEHFGNKFKGQFFTPETITELMAAMMVADDTADGKTVCDPTCGSGRTLLSAAMHNRKLVFYGADIDINCCKMTVLNMMMNTMQGEVAWMDSLKMDHWKSWHIRKVFDGKGYIPYYFTSGPGETGFVERLKNTMHSNSNDGKEEVKVGKKQQILLF